MANVIICPALTRSTYEKRIAGSIVTAFHSMQWSTAIFSIELGKKDIWEYEFKYHVLIYMVLNMFVKHRKYL